MQEWLKTVEKTIDRKLPDPRSSRTKLRPNLISFRSKSLAYFTDAHLNDIKSSRIVTYLQQLADQRDRKIMTAVTKHSMENDGESTADISFKVTFPRICLLYDKVQLIYDS